MKKKFIWIVLFVALVLLFAFLFLWPIQGSLYLNMNEDDGLNSSVYDLSTNRSKKVVIDDYNEVIDYYPLTGGYAAIGVNYVPAQNAAVDGLKGKYALVIHEGKRDFSYPLASSAGIMCVYEDTVYFTIYGEDDVASCYYKCNLSDFSIEKLPDSINDICSDGNTLVYVETLRDHDQVIIKQEGKESVAFSTDEVLCVDLLQSDLVISYKNGLDEKCISYNLSTGKSTTCGKRNDKLEYAATLHGRDWYIYRYEFLHNDFGTPRLDIIVMRSGLRVKFLFLSPTKSGSVYLLR